MSEKPIAPVPWDPENLVEVHERDDVFLAVRDQIGVADIDFVVLAVAPLLHEKRLFRSVAVLFEAGDEVQTVIAALRSPAGQLSQGGLERVLRRSVRDYQAVIDSTEQLLQTWTTRRAEKWVEKNLRGDTSEDKPVVKVRQRWLCVNCLAHGDGPRPAECPTCGDAKSFFTTNDADWRTIIDVYDEQMSGFRKLKGSGAEDRLGFYPPAPFDPQWRLPMHLRRDLLDAVLKRFGDGDFMVLAHTPVLQATAVALGDVVLIHRPQTQTYESVVLGDDLGDTEAVLHRLEERLKRYASVSQKTEALLKIWRDLH